MTRVILSVALFFFALPVGAAPERKVAVGFVSAAPNPQLEDVLYLSLGVELSNQGFSSVRGGEKVKGIRDAPYILFAKYELRGAVADVRLEFSAAEEKADRPLAAVSFLLRLDSSFDADVAGGVRSLLSTISLDASGKEADEPEIGGLFKSELVTRDALLRTDRTVRLETSFSGGGSPFFGSFSDYSQYGAFATAQAAVLFLKSSWSLSVGGRFSLTRALMADGVTGGPIYLSTGGANFQFGLGAAQSFKLAACVSGGGAVITVPNGDGYLSKTVPYADGGIQAGFPIAKDLFLGGDLRLVAVFDPDILIMGTSLSLSVCKEF